MEAVFEVGLHLHAVAEILNNVEADARGRAIVAHFELVIARGLRVRVSEARVDAAVHLNVGGLSGAGGSENRAECERNAGLFHEFFSFLGQWRAREALLAERPAERFKGQGLGLIEAKRRMAPRAPFMQPSQKAESDAFEPKWRSTISSTVMRPVSRSIAR